MLSPRSLLRLTVIEDFHDDQQQQTKPDVRSAGEKIRLGTNKTLKSKSDFQAKNGS